MNAWQWGALVTTIALLAWLTIRYSLFIPPTRGLPILMYHQVSLTRRDSLTVTRDQFESHLQYLSQAGYRPITCRELVEHLDRGTALPGRPVLITFDDGYVNNLEHAYPLLRRYGFCATMFLPVGWLGRTNGWDDGAESIADAQRLAAIDPAVLELGLHSHAHEDFRQKTAQQIGADTRRSLAELARQGLAAAPALAYPYGKYPRDSIGLAAMAAQLEAAGVRCGLRIGNRVNRLPIRRRWELRRINVKGTDSLWEFRVKVRKGRVKLF